MTSTFFEKTEAFASANKSSSDAQSTQEAIQVVLPQLDSILHRHLLFNGLFLLLGAIELTIFALFFTFLIQSALLALMLAVLFLSCFSYLMLRVYYQVKKDEQFNALKESYIQLCKAFIGYQEGDPKHYLALANACTKFSDSLQGRESALLYQPQKWCMTLTPYLKALSSWCHWKDVHHMQELLLLMGIQEHIKLIKQEPISMAAHASLANAYVILSGLYNTAKDSSGEEKIWSPRKAWNPILEKKFRAAAERAIEEFKILSTFAPDDPWVHAQLAYSYRDLNLPLEEIKEYEILARLNPEEGETLFKLGVRYFHEGMNAQGLRVYEQLKRLDPRRAQELISFYGAYSSIA